MEVSSWPFMSMRNKLNIHVKMDSTNGGDALTENDCTAVELGETTSLHWLKVYLNGVTLYLQLKNIFLKYLLQVI